MDKFGRRQATAKIPKMRKHKHRQFGVGLDRCDRNSLRVGLGMLCLGIDGDHHRGFPFQVVRERGRAGIDGQLQCWIAPRLHQMAASLTSLTHIAHVCLCDLFRPLDSHGSLEGSPPSPVGPRQVSKGSAGHAKGTCAVARWQAEPRSEAVAFRSPPVTELD